MEDGTQIVDVFSVEEGIEHRETEAELYVALDELDALSRQIIELLYRTDPVHTEREAAVIVGMSQNGGHQRKVRGLARLKEVIAHGHEKTKDFLEIDRSIAA